MKINKHNMVHLALLGMVLSISACSNSGSSGSSGGSNTDNGDVGSLQIITPKTVYSKPGVAGSSYVVINNPTATAVKNIQYSLTNLTGGASGASVDPASAANCAVVAANSQCNVKVTVESGAVAGSLGLSVSNDSSLLAKLSKSAKAASATPVMGVEQTAYNSLSGADGITLSYYHIVINGTPYILVSGLVASSNAGTFNKIVLVNGSGTALPNQEVISPVSNTQGSTFNVLLPVPLGSNASQTIKVQTQQVTNGQTTVVSTASSSSTLTTRENIGIAEMLPSAVYLTEANPEQTVTFLNTGDAVAQLQHLVSNNSNVEVVFNPSSLSSGTTATAVLKLKDKTVPATTGNITLIYNNGQSQTSSSGTVEQNVNPTPTPSPDPTPTPAPTPSGPTAGLTAVFSPDNDFFTTTAAGMVNKQLTLTNSGNTDENNIILALPANFTISPGDNNSCTVSGNNVTNSLTTSGNTKSCDITVTYANTAVTPQASDNISIAYNYNNGTPASTPTTTAVDYKVTQSTAILALNPNTSQNYGSIVSDNTETSSAITYTLTNSGEVPATDLAFIFGGTDSSLFGVISGGSCVASGSLSNTIGSNTCTINTEFGPAPNGSAGSKSANFRVDYTPYPSGTTQSTTEVDVSGEVTAAPSATFTSTVTANTFTGGTGTLGNPYTGHISTDYTVSVTYTNSSAIAATGFTTVYVSPPTGWSMTTHGCNNTAMAASGTCTDIYTLNSVSTGTTSINLANVTASWMDSSGTYSSETMSGTTVYADLSVPPIPAITITPVANWQTMMGSAYAFSASITNGSSTVTPTVTGLTGNTVSPSSCDLNSAVSGSESCVFIVTGYTGSGNYSYWNPTLIDNSIDVNTPDNAYTYITPGISLDVSATNSATINGNASPHTFSSISGTVIVPYVYLPAPEVGAATLTNTGITWGTGGTVATRFEAGSQSGGGTCAGSQKDNLTGLEWAKNGIIGFEATEGGGPIAQPDYANTTANLNTLPWSDAATAINNMNTAATKLCGYSDWRLPTVNELLGLVNYKATQNSSTPAAWLNSNGFNNVQTNDDYWSATSYGSSNAWRVLFNDGSSGNMSTSNINYVWPVRGGQ